MFLLKFALFAIAAFQTLGGAAVHVPYVTNPEQVVLGSTSASDGFIEKHGVLYDYTTHPVFENYALRSNSPTICDSKVKQYAGYLDISDTRHLFFWFFESRNDPTNAPLMLWLNGGPGCSSIASGLLFENGPCSIVSGGNDTAHNPYSWNEIFNIIYLDEPIGTGYSYTDDGSQVDTLADLTVDVYAFLRLFLQKYPQYADLPFHIAGESWGGHYAPHVASYIYNKNQEIIYYPRPGMMKINLESLTVANGLTEPKSQFESIPDYFCDGGAPYPNLPSDSNWCTELKASRPVCTRMIDACYRFQTRAVCTPATFQCWGTMMLAPSIGGKNPYDLRMDCDPDAEICYPELDWTAIYMNSTAVKKAIGADPGVTFKTCNMDVNAGFYKQGQAMLNSAALLPELINHGIRVMAYAGNTDGVCNYMGVELWMSRLEHKFHPEFERSPSVKWRTHEWGYLAGEVRSAGQGSGNVTFVQIYNAGHMAPHDQPGAALDMMKRWIKNDGWTYP